MSIRKFITAFIISVCLVLIMSPQGHATPGADIFYDKSELEDGWWKYDFTFRNTSSNGECLFRTRLLFFDPEVFGYELPTGWESIRWEGTHITDYMDTHTKSNCIESGDSLGGFVFDAKFNFDNIRHKSYFHDENDNLVTMRGDTTLRNTVPVPVVPEPVSSVLFIAGGATLGFRKFRKKKTGD